MRNMKWVQGYGKVFASLLDDIKLASDEVSRSMESDFAQVGIRRSRVGKFLVHWLDSCNMAT